MFEDSARKGLTSITGPLIWTCSFYDDSARQKCVVCKAEPHYWKSHLSFSVFGHFDSSFSHLNQHAFTHPSTQWSSRSSNPQRHMLTYGCTQKAPSSPFHRDLKDTQSTFTGALMALRPMLLLPPFLLLLLFLLLLMSSAGLSLLYHGVINHATGSCSASNFQLWYERVALQRQAKTICSIFFVFCFLRRNYM